MEKIKERIISILPGFFVCFCIALLAKGLAIFVPSLGAATLSIFLGILFGNTILKNLNINKGVRFSESDLLAYSIVLLGGTLPFSAIVHLGFSGVSFIIIQMTITIVAAIYIGKKLQFSQDFSYLMAAGNGVCGSSAIGATAPVIGASNSDKAITITIVNITGTVLMLLLPLLSNIFFNYDELKSSALIGGVLQSVGQVVASGAMIDEEVKDLATIFKIVRILFLVFVIIILGKLKHRQLKDELHDEAEYVKKTKKLPVPWYIIGFFITCFLFSIGFISQDVSHSMKWISSQFEIIALAGIGMSVKIRDLISQGVRSGIYALCIGLIQVVAALILIFMLF